MFTNKQMDEIEYTESEGDQYFYKKFDSEVWVKISRVEYLQIGNYKNNKAKGSNSNI